MGRNRHLTNKWAMLIINSTIPFLVATMCTISSPAFSSAIVHACEYKPYSYGRWPAEAVAKGAYYAQGAYATYEYHYCFEAFSESAQGACEALIAIINAQPVSAALRFLYSPPSASINPNFPWSALCKSSSGVMFLTDRGVTYSSPMFNANPGAWYKLRDPVSYTIILTGDGEVEPSTGSTTNTLPIIATVVDQSTNQPPTNPLDVRISIKVDPASGGHDHGDSTRPRGGVATVNTCPSDGTCWSNPTVNGAMVFDFIAPEASGTHTIAATCDGCSNTVRKTVDVKVEELELIPASEFYTSIGETDKHSDNHYLTPEAAAILWRIAVSYQVEQQFKLVDPVTRRRAVTPPVLYVNDASLKWGGKFDLSGRWAGSHYEHRRGTVVDIRANAQETAIPAVNFDRFILLADRYGADALLEEPDINRRHFHLRLLNREE